MKAIQLDLFTGIDITVAHQQHISSISATHRQQINIMTLNPCVGCPVKEMCSWDDCGMKLYDQDEKEKNYYPFEEWLSDPLY